jgi:hypothetical protein
MIERADDLPSQARKVVRPRRMGVADRRWPEPDDRS